MSSHFHRLTATPAVAEMQRRYYGRSQAAPVESAPDQLGPIECAFIAARDSFYLATVSQSGWPYIQHRGGPTGFLHVLAADRLAFADLGGNRQMLSTGNLAANDRVALFLMDYPQRSRLKLLGHAQAMPAEEAPELVMKLAHPALRAIERIVTIKIVAFDWNCPKHIAPRFTKTEVETVLTPLRTRIAELEERLRRAGAQP